VSVNIEGLVLMYERSVGRLTPISLHISFVENVLPEFLAMNSWMIGVFDGFAMIMIPLFV